MSGRAVTYNPPPPTPRAQIIDFVKFEMGNTVMVTKGRNTGRVGTLVSQDSHPGSFDICHIKDAEGATFATRLSNVFVIGKGGDVKNALVSLPKGKGIKLDIFQRAWAAGSGGAPHGGNAATHAPLPPPPLHRRARPEVEQGVSPSGGRQAAARRLFSFTSAAARACDDQHLQIAWMPPKRP